MARAGPTRLCRWEYVEGNRISDASNWKTYSLPTGEKAHFYENRGGMHEETIELELLPPLPLTLLSIYHQQGLPEPEEPE